jgi:hypothetical protein
MMNSKTSPASEPSSSTASNCVLMVLLNVIAVIETETVVVWLLNRIAVGVELLSQLRMLLSC